MSFFISIVLGCIVAIALVIGLCVIGFRFYLKKMIEECGSDDTTPLAIHLHEDLAPDWIKSNQAKALINEFVDLGFTRGTAYEMEEMEQVVLISLFHEKYTGVVYQVSGMGCFFDIVHEAGDGSCITGTTMPNTDILECQPGKQKLNLEGYGVKAAFDVVDDKCAGLETERLSSESFRERFERYYKEEQAYRNRNGGISLAEFEQFAQKDAKRHSEQHIRETFVQFKKNELVNWNSAGVEEFLESNNIPEEEQYGGICYFIVPEKTNSEALVHYLADYDLVNHDQVEKIAKSVKDENNIVALFDRINGARSPERRAKECGVVSFPVEGKIYQLAS